MNRLAPVLLLALAACASAPRGTPVYMSSTPPTPGELDTRYVATGEIFSAYGRDVGLTNSYGTYQVVGPRTSLSYTREGKWGGTLAGEPLLVSVSSGRITGADVNLEVRRDGEEIRVTGLWHGTRLDLGFRPDGITGNPGRNCSLSLRPAEGTWWRGFLGCPNLDTATIRLERAASELPDVAMPQWLFAFLAGLPEVQQ